MIGKRQLRKILKFSDVEIEIKKFHYSKETIKIMWLLKIILISDEFAYGKSKETDVKYFM